jgi:hypothetical protein
MLLQLILAVVLRIKRSELFCSGLLKTEQPSTIGKKRAEPMLVTQKAYVESLLELP